MAKIVHLFRIRVEDLTQWWHVYRHREYDDAANWALCDGASKRYGSDIGRWAGQWIHSRLLALRKSFLRPRRRRVSCRRRAL